MPRWLAPHPQGTLRVESLLPLTKRRESADQATCCRAGGGMVGKEHCALCAPQQPGHAPLAPLPS